MATQKLILAVAVTVFAYGLIGLLFYGLALFLHVLVFGFMQGVLLEDIDWRRLRGMYTVPAIFWPVALAVGVWRLLAAPMKRRSE